MASDDRRAAGAWLAVAGVCAAFGVILGALSGHADTPLSHADYIEKASRYALWHGLALALVGTLKLIGVCDRWLDAAGFLFVAGVVLFSGGLTALSFSWPVLPLIPVGGSAFIVGWLCIATMGVRLSTTKV